MQFVQRRNLLTTHFSVSVLVAKRRMTCTLNELLISI